MVGTVRGSVKRAAWNTAVAALPLLAAAACRRCCRADAPAPRFGPPVPSCLVSRCPRACPRWGPTGALLSTTFGAAAATSVVSRVLPCRVLSVVCPVQRPSVTSSLLHPSLCHAPTRAAATAAARAPRAAKRARCRSPCPVPAACARPGQASGRQCGSHGRGRGGRGRAGTGGKRSPPAGRGRLHAAPRAAAAGRSSHPAGGAARGSRDHPPPHFWSGVRGGACISVLGFACSLRRGSAGGAGRQAWGGAVLPPTRSLPA